MKAADIMTTEVITIAQDAALTDAIDLMLRRHISGLPVTDASNRVVGILTEADLLRRAETGTQRRRPRWLEFLIGPGKLATEYVHTHGRKVGEVMTERLICATPDMPLANIIALMEKHRIKRVPVMEAGRLVGIVSRANLVQALASVANRIPPAAASDEAIRSRIIEEMKRCEWAPVNMINIIVQDGQVHLHGVITHDAERQALRVMAENTPGVTAVHDHLAWCDYASGTVIDAPAPDETAPASERHAPS